MKRILPAIILLITGLALWFAAWTFYQKSQRIEAETDLLREITSSRITGTETTAYADAPPPAEPAYDPTDLDQTPPGITPFIGTSVCLWHGGKQLRRSEEHTSELQSRSDLVCRLLLEKKKEKKKKKTYNTFA